MDTLFFTNCDKTFDRTQIEDLLLLFIRNLIIYYSISGNVLEDAIISFKQSNVGKKHFTF